MEIERSDQQNLSSEEQVHLDQLRQLVTRSLADGKLSEAEIQSIRDLIHADHKVTPAELRTIRVTLREVLGDANLEYDWS